MPIYQIKNESENLKIGIWRITESEDDLTQMLIKKDVSIHNKPNSPIKSRIIQWLATRVLLSEFFNKVAINYDEYGKPNLDNDWFISISHTTEFVAIILKKDGGCGIDIEKISDKVERIKHKFLNASDLQTVISPEDLCVYWGAKEALYKYYGKKEVLFIENLFIENFRENNTYFNGRIDLPNFKIEIPMVYEKIEDTMLVYTL